MVGPVKVNAIVCMNILSVILPIGRHDMWLFYYLVIIIIIALIL